MSSSNQSKPDAKSSKCEIATSCSRRKKLESDSTTKATNSCAGNLEKRDNDR